MNAQVISINNRIEQRSNRAMARRLNNQAERVKAMRVKLEEDSFDLFLAGVNPQEVMRFSKHLRAVYGDLKEAAIGGNIDVNI